MGILCPAPTVLIGKIVITYSPRPSPRVFSSHTILSNHGKPRVLRPLLGFTHKSHLIHLLWWSVPAIHHKYGKRFASQTCIYMPLTNIFLFPFDASFRLIWNGALRRSRNSTSLSTTMEAVINHLFPRVFPGNTGQMSSASVHIQCASVQKHAEAVVAFSYFLRNKASISVFSILVAV